MSPGSTRWSVGLTGLALAVGASSAWAMSGRFAPLRAAAVGAVWLALESLAQRRGLAFWKRASMVLAVPVGWMAGAAVWDWTLVVSTAVVLVQVLAGTAKHAEVNAGKACERAQPRRPATAGRAASSWARLVGAGVTYAGVLVAVTARALPAWGVLVLLSVPWAVRAATIADEGAWPVWFVAFNGQLVLAFLIRGMVR